MDLPLARRMGIAARIYGTVTQHFAHWNRLLNYDFDQAFDRYCEALVGADDRETFSLVTLSLMASLENGHTEFVDEWLYAQRGQSFGFYAEAFGEEWVVSISRRDDLPLGTVIQAIDNVPMARFFADRLPYLCGSTAQAKQRQFFFRRFLFPQSFTVTTDRGARIACTRSSASSVLASDAPKVSGRILTSGVALITIPSFHEESYECSAVDLVRQYAETPALIIDIRGNGGGNTPVKLLAALMDRPYRLWTDVFNRRSSAYEAAASAQRSDMRGFDPEVIEMQTLPAPLVQPQDAAYKGRLVVLADYGTFSAAEDFLMPLIQQGRAEQVGTTTAGSTGQPFMERLGDGMWFRVGAKRQLFPDGRQFEGVGHVPQHEVRISRDDILSGVDPVLDYAENLLADQR